MLLDHLEAHEWTHNVDLRSKLLPHYLIIVSRCQWKNSGALNFINGIYRFCIAQRLKPVSCEIKNIAAGPFLTLPPCK
jgi:hypothetical protein